MLWSHEGKLMLRSLLFAAGLLGAGGAGGAALFYVLNPAEAIGEAHPKHAEGEEEARSDDAAIDTPSGEETATDPEAVKLIGPWAPKDEYCASGAGTTFKANGRYATEGADGTWKLAGNVLTMEEPGRRDRGEVRITFA
jgi:hypothetical protein